MTRVTTVVVCYAAVLSGLAPPVMGAAVTVHWETRPEQLVLTTDGPCTRVGLEGTAPGGATPGEPELPSRIVHVLVPPGANNLDLQLTATQTKVAEAVQVCPTQPGQTADEPQPYVQPNEVLAPTDALYPAQVGSLVGTARLGGYQLAVVRLNPVRYNAARRELYLATSITATLSFDEGTVLSDVATPRTDVARNTVLALASNPEDIDRFAPRLAAALDQTSSPTGPTRTVAADNSAVYLLITNNSLASAFQPLVTRRTSQGKPGQLLTVETIESAYSGVDRQEKIRNCIRFYYQNHGTVWVALGGSETVVPARYVEGNIPVDLYYSCLDGDWNADNTDLYPEVWVGRIPVATAAQATAYVDKLVRFENAANDGFSGSMLIGSNLTWFMSGLSRPIGYDDHDPVAESEAPMRNLYRNVIQPYWQANPLDLLFTTYSTWDTTTCGDYGVTPEHMADRLNQGYHVAYLWGYGSGSASPVIDAAMGSSLTNADRPGIVYVTASSTAAYDQQEPCTSEAFIRNPNGGAVAFLGATRNAASTDYHATLFFTEVFQKRRATVGEAFGVAMMNEAPYRIYKDNWRSWYLALCLHGDPAVSFKGPETGRHVQIISPHGCEVIPDSGDMVIRWNATGSGFAAGETVKLEYSADGGATWLPVPGAEARPYNGRMFIWESHGLPGGSRYRVRVVSLADPAVHDASDRDFTVGPVRTLTVQSTPDANLWISGTHPNYTNYTYSVLIGTSINLTAPMMSHYSFIRWAGANGDTITYSPALSLICQGNKTVTAEYGASSQYREYYVNDDVAEGAFAAGDDNNDGLAADRPLRHIQQVLDRYADVAAIYVSAGLFRENLVMSRSYPSVRIEGAGAGLTIVDGGQAGPCLTLSGTGACTVRGIAMRNGRADRGGAILSAGYRLTVSRCLLSGNAATASGGGIYAANLNVDVNNSTIAGNAAAVGGAIDVSHATTSIVNSMIHGNVATGSGGAVSARGGSLLTLRGSTLSENTSGQEGGGLAVSENSVADLHNSILWGNHGPTGPQIRLATGASVTVRYCAVAGGAAEISRDAQSTLDWQAGNLLTDPLFRSPSGADGNPATWVDNDFHITAPSPCRNAGDPDFVPALGEADIDGQPRVQADRVDIGADEQRTVEDLNNSGSVDNWDVALFEACATGPGIRYNPSSLPSGCALTADDRGILAADLDNDYDIDQVDFAIMHRALSTYGGIDQWDLALFEACATGPGIRYTPWSLPSECTLIADARGLLPIDFDNDYDIDQVDFAVIQRALGGQ